MPARIQPSTSNDAFNFHAGPILVQSVMARSSLRIEALSHTGWPYEILLKLPVFSRLAIDSLGSLAACHRTRRSCKLSASSYEGFSRVMLNIQ